MNKIALLRNSRGETQPDVVSFAQQCLDLGAEGITVHPRPDERHIRTHDVEALRTLLLKYKNKEFNIEGYPSDAFIALVLKTRPDQVTLVPDPPEALTSSNGWNVSENLTFLSETTARFKAAGIRTSIFLNPDIQHLDSLKILAPDRVELYTYDYARTYEKNRNSAIFPFRETATQISLLGIKINAGHDLNAINLAFFLQETKICEEVSIGHAFVCDCLDFGLKETMNRYLSAIRKAAPQPA